MEEEVEFIGRIKTSGNSLNVTIPVETCDFSEICDGDLVKFKIIKVRKKRSK
jgi:hypothetical protein